MNTRGATEKVQTASARHQRRILTSGLGAIGLLSAIGVTIYAAGSAPPEIPEELQQPQNVDGRMLPFSDLHERQPSSPTSADALSDHELTIEYTFNPYMPQQDCVRYDANVAFTDDAVIVSFYSGFFMDYERYCPPQRPNAPVPLPAVKGSLVVGLVQPVGDRDIVDALTGAVLQPAPDGS